MSTIAFWGGVLLLLLAVIALAVSVVRWAARLAIIGVALLVLSSLGVFSNLPSWSPPWADDASPVSVRALTHGGWQVTVPAVDGAQTYDIAINGVTVGSGLPAGVHDVLDPRWKPGQYAVDPVRDFNVTAWAGDERVSSSHLHSCSPVVILAARGTGEDADKPTFAHGIGSRGWRTWHYLAAQLGVLPREGGVEPTVVSAAPVRYPAAFLSRSGSYQQSRTVGVKALERSWSSVHQACPDTSIVAIGYSQGADVVASVWQNDHTSTKHVVGVVLYADPHFNRRWVEQGIVRPDSGIYNLNGGLGARSLFAADRAGPVQAWCWPADPVCQRLPRTWGWHGDAYDCYEEWAAYELAERLQDGLRGQGYDIPVARQPSCILDIRGR